MAEYSRQSGAGTRLTHLAALVGGSVRSDACVRSVTADSRSVSKGDLFVAVNGEHVHGATFASAAIEAGASAIMTDEPGVDLLPETLSSTVPLLVVDDPAASLGAVAAEVLGNPARDIRAYGITGTNGKTTTAYMLESILTGLGRQVGLIGTVEIRLAGTRIPARLTTPMPDEFHSYLAFHRAGGGSDLVMEASSHALAQGRADPLVYEVAGFTNLTQDHLDFHSTMEEYYAAKASLFTAERCRNAVVTVDDEWGGRLLAQAAASVPGRVAALAVTSRLADLPDAVVGWQVSDIDASGFTMTCTDGRSLRTSTSLPGEFNVANAALAIAMALTSGVSVEALGEAMPDGINPTVPGRMEVLADRPRVVVDFAHNTEALVNAMRALRPSTEGRLVVLTGAAGSRDAGKRPSMGRAVAEYGDVVYITDDDPHDEDPATIRSQVLEGTRGFDTPVVEIGDRRQAIAECIRKARDEDTILLAGRGHETIQEVAGVPLELDDRVEAERALAARWQREARGQEKNVKETP
ncbi:MAG: UDP-N-acetylmuramoyl-L-alanyl-D-glutamate--2,6-diaminopimelate ligase [Actinomycetaceae bacterium]|nr:UDP-N-acetylmuramoyl-L-alanyl-D-glutamate--2,6-diaminopimelate ligase [Actinomycetaceae bacterium]